MRARVLIADDHRVLADALARLLVPEYDVVGIVTDGETLLKAAATIRPDLILLDLAMPGIDGLEAARRLRSSLPEIRLMVLTASTDCALAAEALRVGASGYVPKSAAFRDLLTAIHEVLSGRVYLGLAGGAGVDGSAEPRLAATPKLTSRQQQVLRLLTRGHSMKTAAKVLKISPRTVAFHKYAIMERYGLSNTAALMHFGALLGAVSTPEDADAPSRRSGPRRGSGGSQA